MAIEIEIKNQKVIIDDQDLALVSLYSWHIAVVRKNHWYVARKVRTGKKTTTIYLHRNLVNPPKGLVVDHINGNGLDNRRANLRICTTSQNLRNSRTYKKQWKGIFLLPHGKWKSQIYHNGRRIHLGMFETEIAAALAYDKAAKEFFGEFARLNFGVA